MNSVQRFLFKAVVRLLSTFCHVDRYEVSHARDNDSKTGQGEWLNKYEPRPREQLHWSGCSVFNLYDDQLCTSRGLRCILTAVLDHQIDSRTDCAVWYNRNFCMPETRNWPSHSLLLFRGPGHDMGCPEWYLPLTSLLFWDTRFGIDTVRDVSSRHCFSPPRPWLPWNLSTSGEDEDEKLK